MKAKKARSAKLIIMGILFVTMALAATAGIVAVLAATSRSITSNVNITYTAVDIDGEVEAAYRIGDSGTWTSMNGSSPYRFAADDQTSNKQMNPANIELTSQNRYVEFRYIFRNYGHVDYTAILSLNEVDENNNIKLDYKYNDKSYTPTGYGLVIEGTNSPVAGKVQTNEDGEEYVEMTYYVKATVKQLTRDANYQSDFFWLLENYEAQPGEETIRLATSEYSDNGDGTYTASYSGANISVASMMAEGSTPSIENIWNVPSRFGSASVTKVSKGDELPANTKVVLSDSITEIGETFTNSLGLVDIRLGNNITKIQANAFMGSSLSKIEIPSSVKTIEEYAFHSCSGLTSVEIPVSVTSIGFAAFADCRGLTSIEMPDSVTSIGKLAFVGCSGLRSVELGNGLTTIGDQAFSDCSSLYLEIPKSVTNIGSSAFSACKTVQYTVKVGETFNKEIFTGCENVIIEFENGWTEIPSEICYEWTNLTEVIIPEGVTKIDGSSFYGCSNLTKVETPKTLTYIEVSAFGMCEKLTSFKIPEGVTYIGDGAFASSGLQSLELPSSLRELGVYAFSGTSIETLKINNGITYLPTGCFELINIKSLVIPSSVESISMEAFRGCSSLEEIVFSNNLKMISMDAFSGCSKLTSVNFGNTSGWFVTDDESEESGTNISANDLNNVSTAATYLKSTYVSKYWKRG